MCVVTLFLSINDRIIHHLIFICALKINAIQAWSWCGFFLSNTCLSEHSIFLWICAEATASLMPPIKTGSCLSMDGRRHDNEESWHDGCRECYCHNGREMCALITCPVPNCGNPTIHPGQCCPSCPGNMLSSICFVIRFHVTCVLFPNTWK